MATEITRPALYPECAMCPEVQKIIDSWLNFRPTLSHQYIKTKSISVDCKENNGKVYQLNECLYEIQYIKDKKKLEIPGGNNKEDTINCPHFTDKTSGR